ncbi:MAG TPA: glycosyltransferase family 9 protein [Roseimicrobium sp.]|nr:glycosyltransferase family 9 protein [Roseimicrobium sp.]
MSGLIQTVRERIATLTSPSGTLRWWRRAQIAASPGTGIHHPPRHIVVLRLDGIGDAVMTVPLLRELRRRHPKARISLVVRPQAVNLFECCPYLDEVLGFEAPEAGMLYGIRRHLRMARFCRTHWAESPPDVVLMPRFGADKAGEAYFAWFSGAPVRRGFGEASNPWRKKSNAGCDLLLTDVVTHAGAEHEVLRDLRLIEAEGVSTPDTTLELWTDAEDENVAGMRLKDWEQPTGGCLIAVCPGAAKPNHVWPLDSFARCLDRLSRAGHRFIIVGGDDARGAGEELVRRFPGSVRSVAGQLTLRQTLAVIRKCDVVLSNDTSIVHLAAAVQKPVVVLYPHPVGKDGTHPDHPPAFYPWKTVSQTLHPETTASPCTGYCTAFSTHCIRSIGVEQVTAAVAAICVR